MTQIRLGLGLYTNQEVVDAVQELFGYEEFVIGMRNFLPKELSEYIIKTKDEVQSSFDFQNKIIHPFLNFVKESSMHSLESSGIENLGKDSCNIFLSNHRDIGLDSAFLNIMLHDNGHRTSQIAIGDNLMKHRMAELIFRINKTFAVKRSGGARALYQSSVDLSSYIYQTISEKVDSIWIAQREGRAKDGNDQTQIGLLKMLGLSKKESLKDHLEGLNIIPVTMSYEYDPCDYLKTREYIDKQKDPNYKKTVQEDMKSILQGIKGQKGKVHVAFGHSINNGLRALPKEMGRKDLLHSLAKLIDEQIYRGYKMNPINYIALDLLNDKVEVGKNYTNENLNETMDYYNKRLDKFEESELSMAREYLFGIYANPLKNQLKILNDIAH